MNNEASKVRSIRMTDQQYELLSRNAKDNHLSIGNYLEKIASQNGTGVPPEIMCRLISIKGFLEAPKSLYSEDVVELIGEEIEEVCNLLCKL